MNSVIVNGFSLQVGKVGNFTVMSSKLGHHQQVFLIAQSACQSLGIDIDEASPSEISEAIASLRHEQTPQAEGGAVIIPKYLVDAECVCTACGHHGDDTEARHCYECGCRNEDDKGNCTQCRKGTMVSTCPRCGPYSSASDDAYVPIDFVREDYIQDVINKSIAHSQGGAA